MKNRTNLIFTHKLIKAFADSMVKAFVPLIILKNTNNMLLVMLYLNSYYLLCGVLNIVLKKFLQKYGVIAMALHIVPIIALQFILSAVNLVWWWCLIVALLGAFAQVLYSVPLNLLFAFTDREVNVAKFQISTNIGKLIFILFSGYVLGSALKNSVLILSIVGAVLYIASVVPILYGYNLLKQAYERFSHKPKQIDKNTYRIYNLFHATFSIFQSVLDVIVPIYLYINNLTFEAVAIVMALIELCKIGANLLAKLLVSKNKSFVSCLISAICFIIGCIVILVVKNAVVLYICSCLIAVSFPLLFVPMFSTFCKKITFDNYQFDGMSYRDVYILPSKCAMFLPYFAWNNLIGQFIVGMISCVTMCGCCYKISKEKNYE